jgi:hypothetical protein
MSRTLAPRTRYAPVVERVNVPAVVERVNVPLSERLPHRRTALRAVILRLGESSDYH